MLAKNIYSFTAFLSFLKKAVPIKFLQYQKGDYPCGQSPKNKKLLMIALLIRARQPCGRCVRVRAMAFA